MDERLVNKSFIKLEKIDAKPFLVAVTEDEKDSDEVKEFLEAMNLAGCNNV